MRDVNVSNWLKGLPLAPEFHPTDTEFADPIAYISKIEKQAGAFGICKVIPPLPKPSKKYVFSNLNSSLSKSPELGLDVNLDRVEDNGAVRAVFTTRHQELGQSGKKTKGAVVHKQVWQSGEVYTLDQFESKSKAFARVQLGMVKEVSPLVVETMFWEAACEKPIYIEYANDVPGSGFGEPEGEFRHFRRRRRRGRAFVRGNSNSISNSNIKKEHEESLRNCDEGKCASPKYNGNPSEILPNVLADQTARVSRQKGLKGGNEMEGSSGWKLSNSPWNLQVIARSPGSLTRFMPDDIPGVTSPMVYIGMLFSWFAWHVEDHELHSLNFLHTGSSKTWYSVPGDYAFTFEEIIRTRAYGGNIDRLDALTLLGEKTTLLSPEEVVASGIPCCRLVQNPGEFVVTFPRAYHVGFSHGFNCGEAANFGTPKWLKVAKEAAVRRAAMNYLPMLSHQQLLYLLTMSFISRVPRSLLPGVRSSRLRDRQKEEREMLVKKAFIEDILNENNLLTILLQKSSSSHAVFWDLDSLPSSIKESELCNGTAAIVTTSSTEHTNSENGHSNRDLVSEMSLYMDNLYLDNNDDDLSYGFQVDSGTLPCVACGVLGFPFMAVVQPSEKASLHLSIANSVVSNFALEINGMSGDSGSADKMKPNENNLFHHSIGESSTPESTESKSCPALPDSFATQKDLPVSKGWNTSSGYFRPRIFCLEHAIQIEELLQSKGGANVLLICHSDFQKIKAHAAAVAEEVGIPFKYNEIPLDNASNEDLNLINLAIDNEEQAECGEDWTSKLNINLRQCVKLRKKFPTEKVKHALTLDGLFFDPIPISSSISLNWQSKKSRSKRNLNGSEDIIKPSEILPIEKEKVLGAKSVGRKEDRIIQYQRRSIKSKPDENSRNLTETSPSENPGLLSSEKSVQSHVADSVITANPVVDNVKENTGNETSKEMIVEDKVRDSPCEVCQMQYEIEKNERLCSEDSAVSVQVAESIEITAEICASDGTCDLVTADDFGGDCNGRANEDVIMGDVSDPATSVGPCSDDPDVENFDKQIEKKVMNGEVDDCVNMNDSRNESSDSKTVASNVTPAINESTVARNGSKRKREVPQTEVGFCSDGFIKSPCEGLRPRAMRGGADTKKTVHEKPATKKLWNPSDGFASHEDKRKNRNVSQKPAMKKSNTSDKRASRSGSHKCDLDRCRTSFKTKAELLLHKRNRCPHEGCGKKFSSHKYAVLHLRVHDDNRPLKCSWKGCTMSFKWAWARTEHLRVHTGERPYTCMVDGCGLTFRFVSDYSRHRRKTGHYVNLSN